MYAYMSLASMILSAKAVVLFMVDGGMSLQATLLSIDADNHNRGGSSRQEAQRWPTAVACSQARFRVTIAIKFILAVDFLLLNNK